LGADFVSIDKILMHGHISNTEEDTHHSATYYKNTSEETAFAGWTYKHDDLEVYLAPSSMDDEDGELSSDGIITNIPTSKIVPKAGSRTSLKTTPII